MLLLLLTSCIGLEPVPQRETDKPGHNLDSGAPVDDTGEPLDSAVDENRPPVADAGADDAGSVGTVVSLDGSGSSDPDEDPLTYAWRIVTQPGSSSATLVDDDRLDPQFIPDAEGRYVIGLVVSDGALESDEDTVEVTVTFDNGEPVANAGADQSVTVGDSVSLNGGSSSDPEDDPLQFNWTLVTRPSGSAATLSSSTSATPRFVADVAGAYEITLTVSDGHDTSSPDSVRVVAEADGGGGGGSDCGCRGAGGDAGLLATLLLGLAALARRRPSAE